MKHSILKTVTGMAMICFMITMLIHIPVNAAQTPMVSATSVKGIGGSTVDVTISLDENPGIWSLGLLVGYDHSVLTLKSVKPGTVFTSSEIVVPPDLNKEKYFFLASKSTLENTIDKGTLVTLTFSISKDADIKDYPLTLELSSDNTINALSEEIQIETLAGQIKVEEAKGPGETPGLGDSLLKVFIYLVAFILSGLVAVFVYRKKFKKQTI